MPSAPASIPSEINSPSTFDNFPIPARLWVPCIGEPRPIGTAVRAGEPLGTNPDSTPSPVDGIVAEHSRQTLIDGPEVATVVLDTSGGSPAAAAPPIDAASVESALKRLKSDGFGSALDGLRRSGITANRWTSPDLLAQLHAAEDKAPKYVLCAALDLDPALPLHRTLAAEHAMEMAAGTAALAAIIGASRPILAVPEDMSPAGVRTLRSAAELTHVRLFPLPDEYPLAHPSLLIRRTIRRRLAPGRLPTDAGVFMLDAPAAIALGRWLVRGEPMLRVPVGVCDVTRSKPHLFWVPVGTRLSDVLAAGQLPDCCQELRADQVLRDVSVSRDAIFGGAALAVFASEPNPAPHAPEACLRCGWCVEACPVDIHPAGLLDAAQQHDAQLADRNGLKSCIECGICSYVCPSRLPLLEAIRKMR